MTDNDADGAAGGNPPGEAPDSGTPKPGRAEDDRPEGPAHADGEADGTYGAADSAEAAPREAIDAPAAVGGTDVDGAGRTDVDGAGPPAGDPGGQAGGAEAAPAVKTRRRTGRWVAAGLALVVLAGAGTAYGFYARLQGNIHKEHVEDRLGPNRPVKLNKSMNILLLGSDSRDGENRHYWSPDISGERSDTTILLHLSPNRDRAVAVSFPRDSMVQVPQCEKKNGQKVPAFFGMINAAFAYAGAPCTWKTIESTTDIHIDHYVKIDFTGFKRVVNALGGVEICVPHAVNDPRAELTLKAGRQVVKGDEALGYVRTRYGIGDGSDLERIQRQQQFMASVVKKATGSAMLTEPAKTYAFLDAVTKSIATDDELSLSAMKKLATSLKGMSAGTVRFVTVPTEVYPKDPNRVQWDMAQARPLFDAIREDDALPAPRPAPAKPAPPRPEDVKLTVLNAPKTVVGHLRSQRFTVHTRRGPAQPETLIRYGPGAEGQADTLATVVPGVRLAPDQTLPANTVTLVAGPTGIPVQTPDIPKVHGEINAARNPCAT